MVALFHAGKLCRSATQQRVRNRIVQGSSYEVPHELQEALQHSYIHPNIGAPSGMLWRCRAGTWRLRLRGG
eukprot:3299454-Amphidinium_carterae.1